MDQWIGKFPPEEDLDISGSIPVTKPDQDFPVEDGYPKICPRCHGNCTVGGDIPSWDDRYEVVTFDAVYDCPVCEGMGEIYEEGY